MSRSVCSHLQTFKQKYGLHSYRLIHKQFIAVTTDEARRRKVCLIVAINTLHCTVLSPLCHVSNRFADWPQARNCICFTCRQPDVRLHSCLYCVFFGCFASRHIHNHSSTNNHNLGNCLTSLSMYLNFKYCPIH